MSSIGEKEGVVISSDVVVQRSSSPGHTLPELLRKRRRIEVEVKFLGGEKEEKGLGKEKGTTCLALP
jgi:hypothetical protein